MAGRNGKNLLEGALRIAGASGRSHPARLTALLRLLAHALDLASATVFLPDENLPLLSQRFSSTSSPRGCAIPFGSGGAGHCAQARVPHSCSIAQLHTDEPVAPEAQQFLCLPVLEGPRLQAVLTVGSDQPLPPEKVASISSYLGVISLYLAKIKTAMRSQRNVHLIAEVGKLLNAPLSPAQLLPRLIRLSNSSGLSRCAVVRLVEGGAALPRIFKGCRPEARPELSRLLMQEQLLSSQAVSIGDATLDDSDSALCLPLSFNHKVLGTFTFFGTTALAGGEERTLAETLARLLSSALAEAISSGRITSFTSENEKKLKELSLLYRMSNTMLSTIQLNKLIHLTLTALTSGPTPFFERAMLFLTNERSGVLLGMLGVTTETSPPLTAPPGRRGDILASRWDISDEQMASQRESEFSKQVRGRRLELNPELNVASRSALEKRLIYVPNASGDEAEMRHPGDASAFAVSPLIAHGKAAGVVIVDNALSHAPITREDLRFLQLFTNQAGMAIENSILYNRIEDANRRICEAQEHLLQKERLAAIGEMATGIAHELKGPLVAIGGFAGRLTKKLPEDSNERGHADLIVREVLRLETILSEILLFSKKATICYAECSIVDVVRESLAVVLPSLEEKGIAVSYSLPEGALRLMGDGQQLKQVFINILLNAQEAMKRGGKLDVSVEACHLAERDAVTVKISDTGGGIPLEVLNNIFTPFYTTKESGTGLGLAIANRIITNHGGKILVDNHPGVGVEFKIQLPLAA